MNINKKLRDYKNIKNQIGLRGKIFGYLIGMCGILLIVLWLFQIVFLDNFYRAIKFKELNRILGSIESNINSKDLGDKLQKLGSNNNNSIEIITREGEVVENGYTLREDLKKELEEARAIYGKENVKQNFPIDEVKIKLFEETLDKDLELFEENTSDGKGSYNIFCTKIIESKKYGKVMIYVETTASSVGATKNTLMTQMYFVTGIMITLSTIVAFFISKKVSSPISKLNKSAKVLGEGNYNITFDGKGYSEVEELSNSLNYAAKELSKVDKLQKELIANVSHDLRTPLTLIKGYAEVMRDIPGENNSENAITIIDETARLNVLVNDILDLSKIQKDIYELELQEFNLTVELEKLTKSMAKLLGKKEYKILFKYDDELTIYADKSKITQCFYNLLVNAINYTGEDKTVKVTQTIIDNSVKIEVKDTGIGINEKELESIWERYYRAKDNHNRGIVGTGLGLSIVKSIVKKHHGKYGVKSKLNEGSCFWFQIPVKYIEEK